MLAKDPTARATVAEAHQRLVSMAPRLAGLPALSPTRPERESEESPTSMKLRAIDPQEQATILRGKKSKQTTEGSTKRRGRIAIVALVLVVLAGALVGVVISRGGSPSPSPSPSPHGPATATYAFKPQSYPSGLIVDRTWTLSGKTGNELRGMVTLDNGTIKDILTTYYEVIPKSVAKDVAGVTFHPTPEKIVSADPVVQYGLNLTSGGSSTISYSTKIGKTTGSWATRLRHLASDQISAQSAFLEFTDQPAPVTLATLIVSPSSLTLTVGDTGTLILSGTMSNGTAAPGLALEGVAWRSANSSVASVLEGNVIALGAGTSAITAQAGSITASATVNVKAPAGQSTPAGSSTQNSSAGSKSNGGSSTGTSGNSGTSAGTTGGGATTSTPDKTNNSGTTTTTTTGPAQGTSTTSTTSPLTATTTTQQPPPVAPPTTTTTSSPATVHWKSLDMNGDGVINCADAAIFDADYSQYNGEDYPPADLNGDGVVNFLDLAYFAYQFPIDDPDSASCS